MQKKLRGHLIRKAGSLIAVTAGFLLVLTFIAFMKHPKTDTTAHKSAVNSEMPKTYLALGDSYTIGHGVPAEENFPAQTVRILRQKGHQVKDPVIIATTGWTTGDLQDAIRAASLAEKYDFVSLLIGLNNEYQNLEPALFAKQFEELLNRAIRLAGGDTSHVFVLSIPDWSATPFATAALPDQFGRDQAQVSRQIGEYNAVCQLLTGKYKVAFVEITTSTRRAAEDHSLVTADGLHPSPKEYAVWADKLAGLMENKF